MNENDILDRIAKNLSEKKHVACLSDYEVLCNNITFLFIAFANFLFDYKEIVKDIENILKDNINVQNDFKSGQNKAPFTILVPSLLNLLTCLFNKFEILSMPEKEVFDQTNVSELHKGFMEYNSLITSIRQIVDNVVQVSYQLSLLETKEFNYLVLSSLNSFEKYATKSMRNGFFNQDIDDILTAFRNLDWKQIKNSTITKCQSKTFNSKVNSILLLIILHPHKAVPTAHPRQLPSDAQ
jgi:hypothetical protein